MTSGKNSGKWRTWMADPPPPPRFNEKSSGRFLKNNPARRAGEKNSPALKIGKKNSPAHLSLPAPPPPKNQMVVPLYVSLLDFFK